MSDFVRKGSLAQCSKGTGPGVVMITHAWHVTVNGKVAAHTFDAWVSQCGMCTSMGNPGVMAEEGAPVPCTPISSEWKWKHDSKVVKMNGLPAIHSGSTLKCMYGGEISIVDALQHQVTLEK